MKKKKTVGASRQQWDQAFKPKAVCLWQSSGWPAAALAEKLGIKSHDLYRWKLACLWGRRP